MRLSRHQLRSMLAIVGVFTAVGTVYELLSDGVLTLAGPLIGVLVGAPLAVLQVLFPMQFMRRWPFAATMIVKALLYILLILFVFLARAFVYGLMHDLTLRDLYAAVWSSNTIEMVAVGLCTFIVIVFFQQLNRLLGPGNLVRYIFGRYHWPRQEARIFMFLDLKGATSIAERLGVGNYYAFLNDVFHHIAEPVLATKAQIYQYVGDQVVLTWRLPSGMHDGSCVRVFFEIDAVLQRQASYYLARYGLVPEFKAGLHGGDVISAEIGDLKRDLIYSGDVLNTAARIQSECNRLNARFLVSRELFERSALPNGVEAVNLGEVDLRGKRHAIELIRLQRRGEGDIGASEQHVIRQNQPA